MKRAISRWLRRIFGEVRWSPPDWVRALGAVLGRVWAGFAAARRDAPALVYGELAAIAFLLAGGCGIWAWVATRPQAQRVEATADALRPTPLRDDAVPDPLMVRFSGPAAPLDQVGRPVSEGLSVTPPLAGEWRWETDALLVFRPRGDWPVGTRYTLRLSPRVLRPGIRLASRELAFSSPAFFASITEFAFNDDPVDPQEKTVVATVVFSHAVDKTELERRIELRLRVEPVADFDDRRVRKLGFRVSYDERGGKAFIRSERIPLQEREGEARLELEPGIRALAGGPGTEFPQREHARVPSVESYFRIARAQALFATAASHEVDRLVSIEATAPLRQADLAGQVELYLL
ncbi:MAG TPA: hypothetical protein VEI82_03830, partial [Myxococcota bacterium]|nr:hypothetical protein [Myxococcota bacterium]